MPNPFGLMVKLSRSVGIFEVDEVQVMEEGINTNTHHHHPTLPPHPTIDSQLAVMATVEILRPRVILVNPEAVVQEMKYASSSTHPKRHIINTLTDWQSTWGVEVESRSNLDKMNKDKLMETARMIVEKAKTKVGLEGMVPTLRSTLRFFRGF